MNNLRPHEHLDLLLVGEELNAHFVDVEDERRVDSFDVPGKALVEIHYVIGRDVEAQCVCGHCWGVRKVVPLQVVQERLSRDDDAELINDKGQDEAHRDGTVVPIFVIDEVFNLWENIIEDVFRPRSRPLFSGVVPMVRLEA